MPAKVKGPTDHVVVVGAGLAGLSAALRLAGAGRKVTVVERESVPGGRNGLLKKSGYSFDTGPSVLTMPDLISDALDLVNSQSKDLFETTIEEFNEVRIKLFELHKTLNETYTSQE